MKWSQHCGALLDSAVAPTVGCRKRELLSLDLEIGEFYHVRRVFHPWVTGPALRRRWFQVSYEEEKDQKQINRLSNTHILSLSESLKRRRTNMSLTRVSSFVSHQHCWIHVTWYKDPFYYKCNISINSSTAHIPISTSVLLIDELNGQMGVWEVKCLIQSLIHSSLLFVNHWVQPEKFDRFSPNMAKKSIFFFKMVKFRPREQEWNLQFQWKNRKRTGEWQMSERRRSCSFEVMVTQNWFDGTLCFPSERNHS